MCGMPTTRKETSKVVPNREVVKRDRGWRWGGMLKERTGEVLVKAKCYCMLDADADWRESATIVHMEQKDGAPDNSTDDCDPTSSYPLHPRPTVKGGQTSARQLLMHQHGLGTIRRLILRGANSRSACSFFPAPAQLETASRLDRH